MTDFEDPFIIIKAPQISTITQQKKKISKKPKKDRKNCWTSRQTKQYVKFFKENSQFSHRADLRKSKRVFNQLHKFIPTRTPVQIKSHHQKLLLKYKTIDNAIKKLEQMLKNAEEEHFAEKPCSKKEENEFSDYFIRQAELME